MNQELQQIKRDNVTELVINRADKRNSLTRTLVCAMQEAISACYSDGTRLLILHGEGKHFCAGFDLSNLTEESDDTLLARFVRIELLLQSLARAPFSTCAVARGATFGAGADLFVVCDYRYATADAYFAFPGAQFGLVLGTRRLAERIGGTSAQTLITGGGRIPAERALELGLATAVIEESKLADALQQRRVAATRLDTDTHRAMLGLYRRGLSETDLNLDLAALSASAARPGIRDRIGAYIEAQMRKR